MQQHGDLGIQTAGLNYIHVHHSAYILYALMDTHGYSATRAENTNAISSKSGLWWVLEPIAGLTMERGSKRTRTGHQSVTGSGGLQARSWNLFGVNLQQVVDGSPESLLLRPP